MSTVPKSAKKDVAPNVKMVRPAANLIAVQNGITGTHYNSRSRRDGDVRLERRVERLERRVERLEGRVSELETTVCEIKTTVDEMKCTLLTINSNIANIMENLAEITKRAAHKKNLADKLTDQGVTSTPIS